MRGMKKLLSLLLCLCMLAQNVPVAVFAAGDAQCAHHEEHTAQCGYVPGVACGHVCGEGCQVETTACVHIHGEDGCSYVEATETEDASGECNHSECTAESGCVRTEAVCAHSTHEDCGYAEGVPYTFDPVACTLCAPQEEIPQWCDHPDCDQTDNAHVPACSWYVRTYEECLCVLSCQEEGLNEFCETCYFEGVEACGGGEEEQIPYDNKCGENATWTLIDGVLTISDTGAMTDYLANDVRWDNNCESIKSVVIESGITSIGRFAFMNCVNLTNVTIPSSVKTIGNYAFDHCTKLENITIPEGVESIGQSAFCWCASLTSITIPSTVKEYGYYPFSCCEGLTSVNVAEGSTILGFKMFENCFKLTNVTLPSTLTTIEGLAFYNTSITSITIPASVKTIGNDIFYGCDNLDEVTFEGNPESMDNRQFGSCTKSLTINVPCNWSHAETYAVSDGTVTVNKPDHEWENGKCKYCGVIGGYCGRTASNESYAPNQVWTLENGTLTISGSGYMMVFEAETAPWQAYKDTITKAVVNEGMTSIEQNVFHSCKNLEDVSLPSTLTHMGVNTFYNCDALTEIKIPGNLKQISAHAFSNCDNLVSVTIEEGVETILQNAFTGCNHLKELTIPKSVKTIYHSVFGAALEMLTFTSAAITITPGQFSNTILSIVNVPCNWTEEIYDFKSERPNVTVNKAAHNYENGKCSVCGAEEPNTAYTITIAEDIEGGAVTADKETAEAGESVTLTVTPDDGYKLQSLIVDGTDVTKVEENKYTFLMPAQNITVSAVFGCPHTVKTWVDQQNGTHQAQCKNEDCKLFVGEPMEHTPCYTGGYDEIVASCADCSAELGKASIRFKQGFYTGEPVEIGVVKTGILENAEIKVTYFKDNLTGITGLPVEVGTYRAKLSYGGVTSLTKGTFSINAGHNKWEIEPSIDSWIYGESPATPDMGVAKDGQATVIYTGMTYAGTEYNSKIIPDQAGEYQAVFTVEASFHYYMLQKSVAFNIYKADQEEPAAPTIKNVTNILVELNPVAATGFGAVEYAISKTNTAPVKNEWKTECVFEDLDEDTQYYVFARYAGDANHNPAVSEATSVKTKKEIAATGVTLNKENLSLNVGETETLIGTVIPSDADNRNLTWSSSDVTVATVDETGKVTALKAGEATITVITEDGGFTASCAVDVTAVYPIKVQGTSITSKNMTDVLGDGTVSYDPATFTLTLSNASISSESGAAIHSMYSDYTLKIVGTGTNTITAENGSGIYSKHQNVNISGGTFLISGSTNGIFAEAGSLTIDGAQVKAVGTNNGAYAKNGITVTNGGGLLAVTGNKAAVRGTYTMGAENFATLAVSEGAKLIVERGKTVTVSDYITSSGVIEIQGTLKVPAGSGKSTMSGGILYIGTKGYRWDAAKNAYVCLEHDWSYRLKTGTTDTVEAYCDECQSTSSDVLTLSKLTREVYNGPGTTEAALNEYNESVFADVGKILYQKKDGGTAIDRPLTDAGTYIASVTVGSGENAVTASVEYTIAPKPVTLTVTLKANTKVYDGTTTAEVDTATAVGVIRADNQVAVQYGEANYNSPNVADAKEVHFTGWGLTGHRSENYVLVAQPVSVTATITAKSLEDAAATLSDNVIFNGEPVPELTVKDGDRTLEKDKDYTVVQTGSNGEFTMTITGIGNYKDDAAAKPAYLVVTLPDPDKVEPDDKDAIDAYEYYTDRNKTYKDAELEKALNALKEALTAYDVIKGHKSSYTKRSGKTFSLTANGYFGKFTGLKVDGKLLDSKYYTAKSGSTIVTLKNSYLDGLSDGKHAIEFLYTDGSTGDGHYFRIATNNGSPITGDNNHIAMFTGIMMTSLLCMVMMFMLVTRKKGKYER